MSNFKVVYFKDIGLIKCFNFSNEILPEQDERYSILTDGTLMITETKDLDEGVYECMAKNPAGEIKSRAAKMHYLKGRETKNKGKYNLNCLF